MSDTAAKLKWLSIRKRDLDQQLEEAKRDASSGFAEFIQEDLNKIAEEIEALKSESKSSRSRCKHDDSDEGRWRLVGKTMNEVCVEAKLQDYISKAFVYLHAYILRTMRESNFSLRSVHFRFTSGHLQSQTLSTIFRSNTSFLLAKFRLSHNFHSLQGSHTYQIYENLALTSAAKYSSKSNIL